MSYTINPPTPCLWQAPASTQKPTRKTRPAIRRSARWRVNGEVQVRLLSSPAVLIRRAPCEGTGRVYLDTAPATRDGDDSQIERGERRRTSTSDDCRCRTSATLPGIGAGLARGVNGLCPSIEWRARGGRARGDGQQPDGPGMLRWPTGSSASAERTQEDKGRAGL